MCEHDNTEQYDHIYEEGYLVEFYVRCKDCGQKINTWAYGYWQEDDEGEEE